MLTTNEKIGGLPDSNDESDEAREQRRQLGEVVERRPTAVDPAQAEAVPITIENIASEDASAGVTFEEQISSPFGSSQRRRRTKVKAPKRRRSKTIRSSDEWSSKAEESESTPADQPPVELATLLAEEAVVLKITVEVSEAAEKEVSREGPSLPPHPRRRYIFLSYSFSKIYLQTDD